MAHHRTVRALLIVCLLAGAARADGRAHLVKGYAGGRPVRVRVIDVDGTDVEVATARAFRAMAHAASAAGISLRIESGFRTNERQAELYREWRRGAGNVAAPPPARRGLVHGCRVRRAPARGDARPDRGPPLRARGDARGRPRRRAPRA